jgi:hypothetical protein
VLRIDDADGRAPIARGAPGPHDLCATRIAPVVDVRTHRDRVDDLRHSADVVRVLVRDPEQVDGRPTQVLAQPSDEVTVCPIAALAAPGASWSIARIDEEVLSAGEIDEDGESLPDVVEA